MCVLRRFGSACVPAHSPRPKVRWACISGVLFCRVYLAVFSPSSNLCAPRAGGGQECLYPAGQVETVLSQDSLSSLRARLPQGVEQAISFVADTYQEKIRARRTGTLRILRERAAEPEEGRLRECLGATRRCKPFASEAHSPVLRAELIDLGAAGGAE